MESFQVREYESLKEEYESLRYKFNLGYSMSNVWDIPCISHQGEKITHPTQKPIKVIEKIVKASSNPGGLVIDPFMGSGTTGAVCKQLGRRFIGIEKGKKYFEAASSRIAETGYQPDLFQQEPEKPTPGQGELWED